MDGYIGKYMETSLARTVYSLARVLLALLFMQHGAQKLFGFFGGIDGAGGAVELVSLLGLAGVIEFFGGLAVFLGLFTRLAALLSAAEMLAAYLMFHSPQGINPILNEGEMALLYFAGFLIVAGYGAGKWSLDRVLWKKEIF